MMRSRVLVLAAVALLAVAAAASVHAITFKVDAQQQAFLDAMHAPHAMQHTRNLESAFSSIDDNADGTLHLSELDSLQSQGRLSAAEHTLMQAFDMDGSGDVSQEEFMMAPLTLNMLEVDANIASRMAPLSAEQMAAAAAFEGRTVQQQQQQPQRRLRSRIAQQQQQHESTSFSELSSRTVAIPPAGTPRVKAAGGSKRGNAPLPVSIFGVPSVADEECVMCLYFVQRIQSGVAARMEAGPTAPPAGAPAMGGAGLPGATAAAQEALKIRNINSQLIKRPGGRGIVRVVSEDTISHLCAVDKMPLLFNPYCSAFVEPNTINAVRKGVFFNIPTTEVCSQAQLCRDDSYLNSNAAVHATKTSLFLNGQRGICGMLGGSRDRPTAREGLIINAVCAAHGAVFTP